MTRAGGAAVILASGVLSSYGEGLDAITAGILAGRCPSALATGLGYPSESLPMISRLPQRPGAPWCESKGEQSSAAALIATVEQLLADTGDDPQSVLDGECALVMGTGGFLYASNAELYLRDRDRDRDRRSPFEVRGPSWGADTIAGRFQMKGPTLTLSTGCSSSANALLVASEMLARGECRRVLVLGAEGANAVTLSGFASLMLLDPAGCRPFDRDRAGLRLGEGVAALLLGSPGDASGSVSNRHASSTRVELWGGANRCDTHHLTSASPDGHMMAAVMFEAIAQAGITPADVTAIKAHGTGSPDSDAAEARAIMTVFSGSPPPVTALKGYLGHTLGACGALETAALAACLQAGFVPAAAGFTTPDPALKVSPLRQAIPFDGGLLLLNYFGFGGNYTSLVLRVAQGGR